MFFIYRVSQLTEKVIGLPFKDAINNRKSLNEERRKNFSEERERHLLNAADIAKKFETLDLVREIKALEESNNKKEKENKDLEKKLKEINLKIEKGQKKKNNSIVEFATVRQATLNTSMKNKELKDEIERVDNECKLLERQLRTITLTEEKDALDRSLTPRKFDHLLLPLPDQIMALSLPVTTLTNPVVLKSSLHNPSTQPPPKGSTSKKSSGKKIEILESVKLSKPKSQTVINQPQLKPTIEPVKKKVKFTDMRSPAKAQLQQPPTEPTATFKEQLRKEQLPIVPPVTIKEQLPTAPTANIMDFIQTTVHSQVLDQLPPPQMDTSVDLNESITSKMSKDFMDMPDIDLNWDNQSVTSNIDNPDMTMMGDDFFGEPSTSADKDNDDFFGGGGGSSANAGNDSFNFF